jgi:DNA-binding CsgD family transcriptional regulator
MFDLDSPAFSESLWGLAGAATARTPSQTTGLPVELLLSVLDEIDHGVILINDRRSICYTNHLARHELDTRRAICISAQTLTVALPGQEEQLERALGSAFRGHRSMVELGLGKTTLALALVPLNRTVEQGPRASAHVLALCGKRQVHESLTLQFFARARKLSAAEVNVLEGLCSGLKPEDIARQNGVCLSTVRSQIASMRQKTGAKSIRELMDRVSALPPMVPALRRTALQ